MDLAELKAQNEAEANAATDQQKTDAAVQDDQNDIVDDDDNIDPDDDTDTDIDTDSDDSQDDGEKLEDWQRSDDTLPLSAHVKMKHKLKGRISEKNEEIERLRTEIEAIKSKQSAPINTDTIAIPTSKRPDEFDYDTNEEYQRALDKYEMDQLNSRFDMLEKQRRIQDERQQAINRLSQHVDKHYERAEKLINESGIDADVYKTADVTVREAIEAIAPKQGDLITDQLISILGDGSEKVMYYLGRNRSVLNEFRSLLAEDRSGIKAAAFLGEQKARLVNPQRRTSNARPPAKSIKGDEQPNNSAKRMMSKYREAQKKGDFQTSYNLRKKAKQSNIDVSGW